MKAPIKVLVLLMLVSTGVLLHAGSITVGTGDTGNCYPFMCNDSGTNMGPSIEYQQVYTSTAFSGITNINSLTFSTFTGAGGTPIMIGGTYTLEWGYAAFNSVNNLSSSLASNFIGGPFAVTSFVIPAGGVSSPVSYTFNFTPFGYNPAKGNLLLEFDVTNQDNVPNNGINSYDNADDTGTATSRAYCLTNIGCFADSIGLVTTFGTEIPVPTPGSLTLVLSGVGGLLGMLRWKKISL